MPLAVFEAFSLGVSTVTCCRWFQMLFLSFDTDRSGKMSSYELRSALKAAGESPRSKIGFPQAFVFQTGRCL